jgi:hypothetical protein
MDSGLSHFETHSGGIRATEGSGSIYHTTGDTIEVIEPDALGRVVNTAVQMIRRLDS